ncbi:MAG: hypothetical protein JNM21_01975 [Taibaiella sp.]|nr:hypothetical protein [Taibaiella sp.]
MEKESAVRPISKAHVEKDSKRFKIPFYLQIWDALTEHPEQREEYRQI